MSGKIKYEVTGRDPGEDLFPTAEEAKKSLNRTLQNHESKGHKVEFKIDGEGNGHPLWIVEHGGEIIAKYRLVD